MNLVQNPSKYLGINFKLRGRRVADFEDIIDRVQKKLQRWKAKLLSQACKTTLISSVLQAMPLYTFSCFRILETVCNKSDAVTRAFWWEHDLETRKLHLVNWDKICQPKSRGGLGLKRLSLINQAMISKQFWRIQHSPNSLLARTFKAKYFPRSSLQEYKPKPHHGWTWKNIVVPHLPSLHQGHWLIWSGHQIPLTHPDWFQCLNISLLENNLLDGTIADLIDQRSKSWRNDLVKKLYQFPACEEILQLSLPKTPDIKDRLSWKHSTSRDYKVNKAYHMLHQNHYPSYVQDQRPYGVSHIMWLIWKEKLPLKILTFIWKLLHDSLPVFEVLNNRGITFSNKRLMCNEKMNP